MTKQNLVDALRAELPDDIESKASAKRIVDKALELITKEIAEGGKVEFSDFGVFDTPVRKEHSYHTSGGQFGEHSGTIPAHRVVRFKAYKSLKEAAEALPVEDK